MGLQRLRDDTGTTGGRTPRPVQTVQRAATALWILASAPGGLTLAAITRHLKSNRTSVYRLMASLCEADLARYDERQRRYLLGYGILTLAGHILREEDWISAARPILAALRDRSRETVTLAVRSGASWVRVAELEAPQAVRFSRGIGEGAYLLHGASGKVLLAFLDEDELRGMVPSLGHAQLDELARIRTVGYATSTAEVSPDAFAVAAPVLRRESVIAALAVVAPLGRVDEPTAVRITDLVREAAAELSGRLALVP